MSFYQLPHIDQTVTWLPEQPRTVLRFTATGGLVLLHATSDSTLTTKAWTTEPLELGVFGLSQAPDAMEVSPTLCVRLGQKTTLAAPACLLELGKPASIYEWLNARPRPAELRLVLLRLDAERPGQATVKAIRRIWDPEWIAGDTLLRQRLEQQYLNTADDEAGWVQNKGRQIVAGMPASYLMIGAEFRLDVPGEIPGSLNNPAFERVLPN